MAPAHLGPSVGQNADALVLCQPPDEGGQGRVGRNAQRFARCPSFGGWLETFQIDAGAGAGAQREYFVGGAEIEGDDFPAEGTADAIRAGGERGARAFGGFQHAAP